MKLFSMSRPHTNILKFQVLTILVSVLFLGACSEDAPGNKFDPKNRGAGADKNTKSVPVEVAVPKVGTAASYYVTTASLEPNSDAKINARTSGVVRQILREEGDDVKAGDLLLLLEDDDQKLRLKQAEQKLASSQREFERLNRMQKVGGVAQNEWETANNNYLSATTDRDLAELALSYTQITAPFDGRIVWREVDLGESVSTGNLLLRLMAIKPLLLRVHVPANRIGKVAKGQSVTLKVDSSANLLIGVIELVSPIVDPATGTIKVTVKLENYPPSVRPGDFTEISMVTDKRDNALLLPSVAIIEERGLHYLYVEEMGKAVRKNVKIGYVIGEETEVISGITIADKVVNKGQRNLNEGNLLQVINGEVESTEKVVLASDTSDQTVKSTSQDNENNKSNKRKDKRNGS